MTNPLLHNVLRAYRGVRAAALRGLPPAVLAATLVMGATPAPISEICAGGGTDASCAHGCCSGGPSSCCAPAPGSIDDARGAAFTKGRDASTAVAGGQCACTTTTTVTYTWARAPNALARATWIPTLAKVHLAAAPRPLTQIPRAPPFS